ncbi:MAG: four helix bundle protein [Kiritimatiellales bacterium]|nr:four helix bundle protein [Kiritimatiellales bacterium]
MRKRPYENIIAWQEAYKLCLTVYKLSKKLPIEERFPLANQLRRSAYSVPTNIAEGNMKRSKKEKARFYEIAQGSLEELHCECKLSCDLKYISMNEFESVDEHLNRVSYLLARLKSAVLVSP